VARVSAVLTLMEIAVKPLHMGRPAVAEEYEVLLANSPNLVIAAEVLSRSGSLSTDAGFRNRAED
jgi:hypothetical protein